MASSVESPPGSVAEEPLTTAELPRMTASWPASTAPPPASPACWSSEVGKTRGRTSPNPASAARLSEMGPTGSVWSTIRGNWFAASRR
jgi:hypothetical protein